MVLPAATGLFPHPPIFFGPNQRVALLPPYSSSPHCLPSSLQNTSPNSSLLPSYSLFLLRLRRSPPTNSPDSLFHHGRGTTAAVSTLPHRKLIFLVSPVASITTRKILFPWRGITAPTPPHRVASPCFAASPTEAATPTPEPSAFALVAPVSLTPPHQMPGQIPLPRQTSTTLSALAPPFAAAAAQKPDFCCVVYAAPRTAAGSLLLSAPPPPTAARITLCSAPPSQTDARLVLCRPPPRPPHRRTTFLCCRPRHHHHTDSRIHRLSSPAAAGHAHYLLCLGASLRRCHYTESGLPLCFRPPAATPRRPASPSLLFVIGEAVL